LNIRSKRKARIKVGILENVRWMFPDAIMSDTTDADLKSV